MQNKSIWWCFLGFIGYRYRIFETWGLDNLWNKLQLRCTDLYRLQILNGELKFSQNNKKRFLVVCTSLYGEKSEHWFEFSKFENVKFWYFTVLYCKSKMFIRIWNRFEKLEWDIDRINARINAQTSMKAFIRIFMIKALRKTLHFNIT